MLWVSGVIIFLAKPRQQGVLQTADSFYLRWSRAQGIPLIIINSNCGRVCVPTIILGIIGSEELFNRILQRKRYYFERHYKPHLTEFLESGMSFSSSSPLSSSSAFSSKRLHSGSAPSSSSKSSSGFISADSSVF